MWFGGFRLEFKGAGCNILGFGFGFKLKFKAYNVSESGGSRSFKAAGFTHAGWGLKV